MTLYVRAYADYSYEIIYLEGVIRKSRLHILINPGKYVNLPGQAEKDEPEINIDSLTHILAMETSIRDPKLIERTTRIAERTNKPIITNQDTADKFKDHGLSVKQLRIIGFEEQVVEGLQVDPIYLDELSDELKPVESKSPLDIGDLVNKINPLNVMKKLTTALTKTLGSDSSTPQEIEDSNPLAFHLQLGSKLDILIPLDKRGVLNINRILPSLEEVSILVLPNQDVVYTKEIDTGLKTLVILNGEHQDDDVIIIPRTHNTGISHDTLYGGLQEWIEIK